jgi:hypothetical protein
VAGRTSLGEGASRNALKDHEVERGQQDKYQPEQRDGVALSAPSRTQHKLMRPRRSKKLVDGERLVNEVIATLCEYVDV